MNPRSNFYINRGASADGVGPKRTDCGATTRKLEVWFPVGFPIRRVVRTRYVAPIGIVDTSGGLAGLVLPLTRYLVHRDSGDALGNLRVEVFH